MIKIFCFNCGKEIDEHSNFCMYCGTKLISNNVMNENSLEAHSPSFVDEIYGIKFQIPVGFETIDGVDNKGIGLTTEYNRVYSNSIKTIKISVSSISSHHFNWDLNKNRRFDDVEKNY